MSGSYRDLKAWQKAIELMAEIYSCTRTFPKDEQFVLTSQLRRAAVPVPSNIAEGKGRFSDKEFSLFLHHARGSLFEVETQLTIAHRLGYFAEPDASKLVGQAGELARMLNGLIHSLQPDKVVRGAR
ncbi:MAG TPA: four helix bundle protein [Nitrospirota bacterium]